MNSKPPVKKSKRKVKIAALDVSVKDQETDPPKEPLASEPSATEEMNSLRLTELEILKIERLASIIRAAKSEYVNVAAMKRAFLQQIDPKNQLGGFDFQLSSLDNENKTAQKDLETLKKEIESKLNINLSEYAYDDVSGVLRPLPTDKS